MVLFQSTPPRGRRASAWRKQGCHFCFNPRLRVGGDASKAVAGVASARFNPRLRVGGDLSKSRRLLSGACFNPRLRVGGDDQFRRLYLKKTGFNPRLRVGGDRPKSIYMQGIDRFNPRLRVGGDACLSGAKGGQSCFNPRLRVGGDVAKRDFQLCANLFQSTPPRGRRRCLSSLTRVSCRVSIHASAWEATKVKTRSRQSGTFQSTPPRGRRQAKEVQVLRLWCFNPRLRVGGDPWNPADGHDKSRFNPRLRVGGDVSGYLTREIKYVSIHASAWEATYVDTVNADAIDVSIHASAWEAIGGRKSRRIASVFQSTPPRGRRRLHVDDLAGWVMFQSTPPRGRRRLSRRASCWPSRFQSTPPRGRRRPTWPC